MREVDPVSSDTDAVRFLLDGEVRVVSDPPPTQTVLNYLREDLRRTGTKEGCAEGDCGACTVVIAEADGGALRCRAVNSCIQFVPTLDGKALYTVESLKRGERLHPVQLAMADGHGSQCGFCTPGFVMSLFALYKTRPAPERGDIEDALAGNLCRCTGYRPIVDAATNMYAIGNALPETDLDWLWAPAGRDSPSASGNEATLVARLKDLNRATGFRTTHAHGTFHAPRSMDELATLCLRHPQARLLAGGTDVGLWVTKQLRELGDVIYTGGVAELKRLHVGAAQIEIGAAVTLSEVYPLLAAHYPDFGEIMRRFASPPIRNAGTLGGNVANGSPIGDSMPCLIALGARICLHRGGTEREMALEDFYLAYQRTALEPGEFVERISLPLPQAGQRFLACKISKRFDQDISAVCVALRVVMKDGRIRDARLALGGMAATPKRALACEAAINGGTLTEQTVAAGAAALRQDFAPIGDMRASAAYRMLVAQNVLRKFFTELAGGRDGVKTRIGQLDSLAAEA